MDIVKEDAKLVGLRREDGADWGQTDADNSLRQNPKGNQLKGEGKKTSIMTVKLVQSNKSRMHESNRTKEWLGVKED